MGDDADAHAAELAKVRFPAEYVRCLSDLFGLLQSRILEQAAMRAKSRTTGDGPVVVGKEDLLGPARKTLARAADEFERTLAKIEPGYVRSAS